MAHSMASQPWPSRLFFFSSSATFSYPTDQIHVRKSYRHHWHTEEVRFLRQAASHSQVGRSKVLVLILAAAFGLILAAALGLILAAASGLILAAALELIWAAALGLIRAAALGLPRGHLEAGPLKALEAGLLKVSTMILEE